MNVTSTDAAGPVTIEQHAGALEVGRAIYLDSHVTSGRWVFMICKDEALGHGVGVMIMNINGTLLCLECVSDDD